MGTFATDLMPIETAPHDGTIILTENGTCRWVHHSELSKTACHRWANGAWQKFTEGQWIFCAANGFVFQCQENGCWFTEPKQWMPLPHWMKSNT